MSSRTTKTPRRRKSEAQADVPKAPPPPETPPAPPPAPPVDTKDEAPEKPVDVLEELESLYRLQMARIRIDYGTEKKINKLLMQVTSDIRVASDMLWRIAALRAGSLGLRATLKRVVHALLE
jgi:hypothetical protein